MYEKPPPAPDLASENFAVIVPYWVYVLVPFPNCRPRRARKSPELDQDALNAGTP